MNRVEAEWDLPQPVGPFPGPEALQLLLSYRKDPSSVPCPRCGPGMIEVLAFIDVDVPTDGYAVITEPVGEYAAALYCHECSRAIGVIVRDW